MILRVTVCIANSLIQCQILISLMTYGGNSVLNYTFGFSYWPFNIIIQTKNESGPARLEYKLKKQVKARDRRPQIPAELTELNPLAQNHSGGLPGKPLKEPSLRSTTSLPGCIWPPDVNLCSSPQLLLTWRGNKVLTITPLPYEVHACSHVLLSILDDVCGYRVPISVLLVTGPY